MIQNEVERNGTEQNGKTDGDLLKKYDFHV
jgi:hypothetical protein